MDGQKNLSSKRSYPKILILFAFLAIIMLAPQPASAQAMGKAALDAPPSAAALPALPPLPAVQLPAAATTQAAPAVPAPPLVSELKSPPPAAEAKPLVPTVQAAPAPAPALPVLPTPLPAATPNPQPEKIIDSLPAETAKPAVPLLAIEHQAIRPAPSDPATPPSETKTTTAEKPYFSLPSGMQNVLQVAAALAVVLGLVFIAKVLAKKFLPVAKAGTGKGVIEILARYPLSKNQSLVLVRIGSQIVTLNQGKDQSQSVLVINDAQEVAKILGQIEGTNPKSIQAGFNKLLANARMDLESPVNNPENDFESRSMEPENLDNQLEEMAAAKRQLMQLRQQVRSVRDSLPATRR